jgi:hypothetical protein
MGAVPAALGGAAAALALARWVMIHRRGVEAKDRQTWLAESGQDMSTDQGLYISLYFQLKSELEVRNTLKAQGVTAPSSAVFCDEICPLLDLDPEVFVEVVEGLAANFVELMEMQRSTVVEGLMTRQTALTEGVPDPLLARRIDQLGQTGQLGGEYIAGGYKEYKSERKLQTKIEKEQTELHKLKKSDLKETGRLFTKGKTSADSKKIAALRSKRQKLSAKIERDQQQLELLKQSHRPHLRENEVRKRKSDAA